MRWFLHIDRDKAVRENWDAIVRMIRPGNVGR